MTTRAPEIRNKIQHQSERPHSCRLRALAQRSALWDIKLQALVVRCATLLIACIGISSSGAENPQTNSGTQKESSGAQSSSNAPSRFDYSAYRIIADRNIFNPRRSRAYV